MDIDGEITLTTAPRWAHPKGVIRQVHMYSTQSQFTVTVALGRKIPFVVYLFMYCIFMGFFFSVSLCSLVILVLLTNRLFFYLA